MRSRTMCLPPAYGRMPPCRGGERRARRVRDLTEPLVVALLIWRNPVGVKRHDRVGSDGREDAFLDHQFGAALLSRGNTLLRRLKDEHHGPGQSLTQAREHRGYPQGGGYMDIVPARVGDSHIPSEVGAARRG